MKTRNTPAKSIATDETIEQLLWDCLDEIPFIEHKQVEQRIFAHPGRPEIIAKLRIGGQDRTLVAEVKANGQPRLVREAIGEILQYRQNYPNAYGVVIAPVLSAHAMKICRQEGIGYLDLAGIASSISSSSTSTKMDGSRQKMDGRTSVPGIPPAWSGFCAPSICIPTGPGKSASSPWRRLSRPIRRSV